MKKITRICILGDPHIFNDKISIDEAYEMIDSVNEFYPEAVFVVGDLTGGGKFEKGDPVLNKLTKEILDKLKAPWITAIGNHDLEFKGFKSDEENLESMLKIIGRENPWDYYDLNGIRFIILGNERFRSNEYNRHEIVLREKQIKWFEEILNNSKNMPCIIIAHVPPIQSELLVNRKIHQLSLNMYVNQNHQGDRIREIVRKNPQIIMWTSGHIHFGHHYHDAVSVNENVLYMHCGVYCSLISRDGIRQTRIIDFTDKDIIIKTFDHSKKKIINNLTYKINRSAYNYNLNKYYIDILPCAKKEIFTALDTSSKDYGLENSMEGSVDIDEGNRIAALSNIHAKKVYKSPDSEVVDFCFNQDKRFYIATKDGFIWEHGADSVKSSGAVLKGHIIKNILCSDNKLWTNTRDKEDSKSIILCIDLFNKKRFQSFEDYIQHPFAEFKEKIKTFKIINNGIFAELDNAKKLRLSVLNNNEIKTEEIKEIDVAISKNEIDFNYNIFKDYMVCSKNKLSYKYKFPKGFTAYNNWIINNQIFIALKKDYLKKSKLKYTRYYLYVVECNFEKELKGILKRQIVLLKEFKKPALKCKGKNLKNNLNYKINELGKTDNDNYLYEIVIELSGKKNNLPVIKEIYLTNEE